MNVDKEVLKSELIFRLQQISEPGVGARESRMSCKRSKTFQRNTDRVSVLLGYDQAMDQTL